MDTPNDFFESDLTNCNYLYKLKSVVTFCALGVLLTGCQSFNSGVSFKPQVLRLSKPVKIEISGTKGMHDRVDFQSKSFTQVFQSGDLIKESLERVNFTVESKLKHVDSKVGLYTFKMETTEKEGTLDLNGMGYPELGQSFDLVLDRNAKVKRAGLYKKESLFFIPPVSLPEKAVGVGDTWMMKHKWVGESGVPLIVELVSVLKGFYECNVSERCAEIEISGDVFVNPILKTDLKIKSEISGRLLIHVETGSLVWADVRNNEEFNDGKVTVKILSCTESVLTDPVAKRWLWRNSPECDPKELAPKGIPGV